MTVYFRDPHVVWLRYRTAKQKPMRMHYGEKGTIAKILMTLNAGREEPLSQKLQHMSYLAY